MSSQLLRLNAFRGEPASSGFEWHFTPNHNSPAGFINIIGSDLHLVFTQATSWSMISPRFGSISSDNSPRSTRFRYCSCGSLNQPQPMSRRSFSTVHASEPWLLPLRGAYGFHVLFTPHGGSFHPSLTVTTSLYGPPGVFSIARWSLADHTGFTSPCYLGSERAHFARRYYGNRFAFFSLCYLRLFQFPVLLPAHGFTAVLKGSSYRRTRNGELSPLFRRLFGAGFKNEFLWSVREPRMPNAPLGNLVVPTGGDDGSVHGLAFPLPHYAQRVEGDSASSSSPGPT
ncbi:hypothetical protein Tco_0397770 [Tanacetum coccineum]